VLRAFTTAAYAFSVGAKRIWLVESVDEALAMKSRQPGLLAMGEDHGRRVGGFDFANSPAEIAGQDLSGRELVQRTSAGTRGVVAAAGATRRWCASLVCASATAAAVADSDLGAPDYVITGWLDDDEFGQDDMATARLIERVRMGLPVQAAETARSVADSREAARTMALGTGHADPADIDLAVQVDVFNFAMQARQTALGLELAAQHFDGRPPQKALAPIR
jgi:2-phosphosulfolactate phosphatase